MRATYAPQRIFPRFSALTDIASRVPRGLPALMLSLGPLIAEPPVAEEFPSPAHLKTTRLAIVSFPRTGSVFIQALTDTLLDPRGATMRTHDPLLIRTFARFRIPILIPIRDPREAILSWAVYNNDPVEVRSLRARCHSYLAWARKVLRMSHRFPLYSVELGVFVSEPEEVLSTIVSRSMEIDHALAESLDTVLNDLAPHDALPLNQQHTPSTSRERIKNAYRPLLESTRVARLMDEASAVNAEILASSAYAPSRTHGRD